MSVSVADGDGHPVSCATDTPAEHGQANEFLQHPLSQCAGHAKQIARLQEPGRKHAREKGSQLDKDRQPLLPMLFSGMSPDAEAAVFLPAGGHHVAARKRTLTASSEGEQEGRATEEDSELAEEMEALRRARLSRQITEERISKASLSGRRKPCTRNIRVAHPPWLAQRLACTHIWVLLLRHIPGFVSLARCWRAYR
eukprot:COSAG02_NODE_5924_length_3938_cov_4.300078_4_plen_197_part_00